MYPWRFLSHALVLVLAKQNETAERVILPENGDITLLHRQDFGDDLYSEPSYADGVCDNKLIADLPFCDSSLSFDERVNDLVARIPLEETFGLLVNNASKVENAHLPAYGWWSEGLHGVALSPAVRFEDPTPFATSFPQVISLAASFNRTLFYKVGEAIATEARAFYNAKHSGLTFWTPNVNIYRDPRWGRGQETPGEDPFLTGEYAVAFVRGLQGEAPENHTSTHLSQQDEHATSTLFLKVSATCKHFSSYSQEVPRHRNDAIVTKQDQLDTYFPAFKDCVKRGHVSSLMCSYNAVNGIPACADKALMTDLVRKQWGFDGYIVSDCGAVADVIYEHHYTQSPEQTCATTMNAGMDINCGDFLSTHAKDAVKSGLLRKSVIHNALRHLFKVQMRLGMFEKNGQPFANITPKMIDTAAHRQLALEAARQSIVLLKNEKNVLPLNATTFAANRDAALALIGPHFNASEVLLGNYQGIPSHIVTPLEGISSYVPNATYELGCKVSDEDLPDFDEAAQLATMAAQVIMFVGLDQTQEREEIDRVHLDLPGYQNQLIDMVLQRSKQPIVLVVISGGSVNLAAYKGHPKVGAIIFAGYLGQAGGQAIADVLFGTYNPSGALTQTFYDGEFTKQVSIYDMNMRPNADTGNPGRTYRFYENRPVFGFGDGLSYTTFDFEWKKLPPQTLDASVIRRALENSKDYNGDGGSRTDSNLAKNTLNITITNTGNVPGEMIVHLFAIPPDSGKNGTPICFMDIFGRTPLLQPNETWHFHFSLTPSSFALANEKGEWEVREGKWTLQVGSNRDRPHLRHEITIVSPSQKNLEDESERSETAKGHGNGEHFDWRMDKLAATTNVDLQRKNDNMDKSSNRHVTSSGTPQEVERD
uniref:Fibronectin type III-like domain-containing protein n=1 Tax=Globisporangium ultimum (strain ATCC 200006 / CBS 805.95 / DAOM BR144) TaxID=431595 RepID=K3X5N1_GLOUD